MAACASATASTPPSTISTPASTAAAAPAPSTARKFLELGGFDRLLEPFYLEDTDLGYMAWKRGWKVLYQPRSVVYHEHRGTIGKTLPRGSHPGRAEEELPALLLEEHSRVAAPALAFLLHLGGRAAGGDLRRRAGAAEFHGPVARLPPASRAPSARAGARAALARISDTEAFRRPLGGYFRDRFDAMEPAPAAPRVLFVSPYPICPPMHGGGVFMYQTLARDGPAGRSARGRAAGLALAGKGQSGTARILRFRGMAGAPRRREAAQDRRRCPTPCEEFANQDFEWLIHRQIYLKRIDVLQLEYTPMAQYRGAYRRIARGAVRARYLLSIDRPRHGPHAAA